MSPLPDPLDEEALYRRLGAAILLAALEDLKDPSPRVRASAERFFYSQRAPQVAVRRWVLALCNIKQLDLDRLLSRTQTGDLKNG